jgi:hypothetical protein
VSRTTRRSRVRTFCLWNDGRYRTDGSKSDVSRVQLSAADLAAAYLGGRRRARTAGAGRIEEARAVRCSGGGDVPHPLPPYCPEVL